MALLYRFVRIHGRANTHVFTFVVTKSVTRDLERDITSKEFACGYQKWAITFSRTDKVLGVYLVWRSASEGMRVYADFTFTILNREHFSVNESFSGKQIKFTYESPAQGNRNYIPVNDLYSRNFTDSNGEFQLELTIGNVRTIYETHFRVPHSIFGGMSSQYQTDHQTGSSKGFENSKMSQKFESSYFNFGGFDWNIALFPYGAPDVNGSEHKVSVLLNRLTGFDHQCRIRYNVSLGEGEKLLDSGVIENVSDSDGKAHGWHPRVRFTELLRKGVIRVRLEMIAANTLSEVTFTFKIGSAASRSGLGGEMLIGSPAVAQCYDRDKQGWTLKTDCHSDKVRLHMVYKDVHNVPRNHLRYVCWTVYMLQQTRKTGRPEPVPLSGAPFSHYYAQETADEGIIMETDVSIKELKDASVSLPEKCQIRVQVEWWESYLLFQANYHKYDDVCRTHCYQMRKEISALQAENYSLERQLFSYQKSIAYAHSRRTYSDDQGTPDGRDDDFLPYYQKERNYSIGDRSASTDTEYA